MAAPEVTPAYLTRKNSRGYEEIYTEKRHVPLTRLREDLLRANLKLARNLQLDLNKRLADRGDPPTKSFDTVPYYPKPTEFHISSVSHVTTDDGLTGILDTEGFQVQELLERESFLWWGLVIGQDEIRAAENRYFESLFPDRNQEEKDKQQPILSKFTTSSAFDDNSPYGNFRFTFPFKELLGLYSESVCGGRDPQFKIYATVVYKVEINYVVVIHSPEDDTFNEYPQLNDNEFGVCAYRDGNIIWRPQSMCTVYEHGIEVDESERLVKVSEGNNAYYMWDHVTLAFHLPPGGHLHVDKGRLLNALTACRHRTCPPPLNDCVPFTEAEGRVQQLKTEYSDSAVGQN